MDELEALVALVNIAPDQPDKVRLLIEETGSAVNALKAPARQLAGLPGFGEQLCSAIRRWEQDLSWRHDLELVARTGVTLLPYWDPHFPEQLLSIPNAPLLLYMRGSLTSADRRAIAVVGTSRPSVYGGEMASSLSQDLAGAGFTVVSGLGMGTEALAHRAALASGRTIAVVGCGLDALYPPENARLAEEISEYGAMISELPMACPVQKQTLARRHRLISGLATGVLLVEAPIKSSAMATIKQGWRQKRKLFALPGRADAASFRGNHWLIKKQNAQLIETAREIIDACTTISPALTTG